MTFFNI